MAHVTPEEVQAAAARLSFTIPAGHEDDYLTLLGATDKCAAAILALPDYQPVTDLKTFPRKNVHRPRGADNPLCGWAWKATIEGTPGGILDGKTVVFKDTVCVAGVPQEFGTDAFTDFTPTVDATLVTRILEAGGIVKGKATCENFSHGASSFSSPYGTVQNPFAHGFSTGGSSSGCGALIASGEVDMGIGGDQGGSIRIPASLCGIIGMKPTFGLVPYTGVLSSDAGVDHVGPMARTVYETALLLESIAGYDNIDDRQLGAPLPAAVPKYSQKVLESQKNGEYMKGIKVGVLKEGFVDGSMDEGVKKKVEEAVERFRELGATVEEVSIPLHLLTGPLCHIINKYASSQTRQGRQVGRRGLYINEYWEKLLPWTQEKWDKAKYYVSGTAMSAEYGWHKYPTAYGRAQNLARQLRDEYDAALAKYDVLVMPTVTQPARRHLDRETSKPADWAKAAPGIVSNTATTNLTGHPSLSLPVGFTPPHPSDIREESDKNIQLPCGMMLVGPMWGEEKVLCVAAAWEAAGDWKA